MGLLVEGKWEDLWYDTKATGGRFVRGSAQFRDCITADGASGFKAEPGRYHLYVSLACPWAHRTLIFRRLKGLEEMVSVSTVEPLMLEHGWEFSQRYPDPLFGSNYLYELYLRAKPEYSGRVTVPLLWDKRTNRIVNNESAEIIRMFNSAFDELGALPGCYYPQALRAEIDEVNARVYDTVNNGVYKAGFATTQEAYDEAVAPLFETLDWLEQRLEGREFLVGDRLTEADIRLFTTLVRFDSVYHTHFKCNLKRILDYPNLRGLRMRIYDMPGVAGTVDMEFIKQHYFGSHRTLNPHGIVPRGPSVWL